MAFKSNVTIYTFWDEEHKPACDATVAAFRAKGCTLHVKTVNLDDLKALTAEGFKHLPVVKLEREADAWDGHQPDRIAAYQPKLTEFHWDTRRIRGPKLGVWRKWA